MVQENYYRLKCATQPGLNSSGEAGYIKYTTGTINAGKLCESFVTFISSVPLLRW